MIFASARWLGRLPGAAMLVVILLLGACTAVPPPPPRLLSFPLPVEATGPAPDSAYAAQLSGYLRGSVAELGNDAAHAKAAFLVTLGEDADNPALRARTFELSLLAGDADTALRLARSLPAAVGSGPAARGQTMLGLVRALGAARQGDVAGARKELERASRSAPNLLPFRLVEAYLYAAEGKPVAEVVAMLEKLPGPATLQARKQYHIARLWLKAGNTDAALRALEASNTLEPAALFTTLLLGNLYERGGQPEQALELYAIFESRNPQVNLLDGEAARVDAGIVPPAFSSTLDQDLAVALFDFGLLVWAQGAVVPARELLNLALWLDAENPYLYYYSAIVDESGGATAAAAAKYAMIPAGAPVGLAARVRAAELAYRSAAAAKDAYGQRQAQQQVETLLRQRPDAAVPLRRSLAKMAFDARDYRRALPHYDFLLESGVLATQSQLLANTYFARGAVQERLRRFDAAEGDLMAALALEPENPDALNYLAYMWVERGENLGEALLLLEKALLLAPDDGAITDSLGWAYFRQGQVELALPYLERAADLLPDDPTINEHLGDVYHHQQRLLEARRHWQRALDLADPADDPALPGRVRGKLRALERSGHF